MAESRRFADLEYGHLGQIAYIPQELSQETPGTLYTARLTSGHHHFSPLGTSAVLYPPKRLPLPTPVTSRQSTERNLQKRWLLKSHPEAFLGNEDLSTDLAEDTTRFRKLDESRTPNSLLDIGFITDYTQPSRAKSGTLLAVASGTSGELLRLARLEDSKWVWDADTDDFLRLSIIDPTDQDEELTWGTDALPISKIKFTAGPQNSETTRWLLVQKQNCTMVLQPVFRTLPQSSGQSSLPHHARETSRISVYHLLTIGHRETGGNAHCDVSFRPAIVSRPPQLCIIDECGYWTLWNITGSLRTGKNTFRSSLYKCGHIWEGLLNEIPTLPSYAAEHHGTLFVGSMSTDDSSEDSQSEVEGGPERRTRMQNLLLWSRDRIEVINVDGDILESKLASFLAADATFGHVLDVQLCPFQSNHIYILTTRFVILADLFHSKVESASVSNLSVIVSCPHLTTAEDGLRMSIPRVSEIMYGVPSVFVHSSLDRQMSIHWFSACSRTSSPQWHRQVLSLAPIIGDCQQVSPLQALSFQPVRLITPSARSSQRVSAYRRGRVRFYQGMMLGEDLSVRYCMCYSAQDLTLDVELPITRIEWTKTHQNRRWRKKRLKYLRAVGESFVLPDEMSQVDMEYIARRPKEEAEALLRDLDQNKDTTPTPIEFNFRRFSERVEKSFASAGTGDTVPSSLLLKLNETIQSATDGSLPLTTLLEIRDQIGDVEGQNLLETGGLEPYLQQFVADADGGAVFPYLGNNEPNDADYTVPSMSRAGRSLMDVWLQPLKEKMDESEVHRRADWVAELVRDLNLATCGVAVQDVPLFGEAETKLTQGTQGSASEPIIVDSSQPSSARLSGSPTKPYPETDPVFKRLRLLAPSVEPGKLGALKQASVLSFWPEERGVDTVDYVSSVAVASDQKFDVARQRRQRIETRRKTMAEKYKLPAALRQGSPSRDSQRGTDLSSIPVRPAPTHIMSSQQVPSSSQTQGPDITMSQPVSGLFGDRKKSKKAKKKSGFR